MADGVSTSGSWPALGEMSQKAKREGERSPPEKAPGMPLPSSSGGAEDSSAVVAPPPSSSSSLVGVSGGSSQEKPAAAEKKSSGGEGVSPSELLDMEQQKLAGRKKGKSRWEGVLCGMTTIRLFIFGHMQRYNILEFTSCCSFHTQVPISTSGFP